MKLFESLKASRDKIMAQPKEERFSYFWDYYKWPAIIAVVLVIALIQTTISIVNRKETVFTGYILNSTATPKDEDFLQGFFDYAGLDSSEVEAAIYSDMYLHPGQSQKNAEVFQRIMAGIAINDADIIVGQAEPFRMCAYNTSRIFADLRNFLDAETLEKFSDRLYYIDGAVLEKLTAPVGETVNTAGIIYPNPTKPELMEDPIPVGLAVGDREALRTSYYYSPDTVLYLGVITNTQRPELTQQFIDYIFS
ncbi:MAG: hypothetical protein IKB80_01030 [Oscillospiraceae bacterium]|nr:hypothetical protein [Oscillospiraceae bacterium]